jgi:hypothetical protein
MLDRLYSLYVNVISTIRGYGDYFWADVVEKIDEMGEQVGEERAGDGGAGWAMLGWWGGQRGGVGLSVPVVCWQYTLRRSCGEPGSTQSSSACGSHPAGVAPAAGPC